jgi:hypothetical protein
MAYTIKLTNGTTLTTIADGTTSNASVSSLTLIGKNYSGYGTYFNDNMVHMLENSSNATAPLVPLTGQMWWDTAGNLKVYTGANWKTIGSITANSSQPSNPVVGNAWWDSTNQQLNMWNGSTWSLVGPAFSSNTGTSGSIVETVTDTGNVSHTAVKIYVGNQVVGIFSKDSQYAPSPSLDGFTYIQPGMTLSSTVANAKVWGTADNATNLGSVSSTNYARTDIATTFNSTVSVASGSGLTVGASNNFTVGVSGSTVQLTNNINNANIAIRANIAGTLTSVLTVNGSTGTITGYQINAQYADLAERFESDNEYSPGTVLAIGGEKEVTLENEELSENVFGVISTRAGYLMNSAAGPDSTHPPVAVSGRVPVRVIGKVKKGDRLVSAGNGLARTGLKSEVTSFNVIGRSLENKLDDSEGVITAIVKLNS